MASMWEHGSVCQICRTLLRCQRTPRLKVYEHMVSFCPLHKARVPQNQGSHPQLHAYMSWMLSAPTYEVAFRLWV